MIVPENETKKQQFWSDQCQEITIEGSRQKDTVNTCIKD